MDLGALSPVEIRGQVDRISASNGFCSSPRLCAFLQFSVERTLAKETDQLKEIVLGTAVCGRSVANFDPRVDPVVRVTARRLRDALEKYYQGPGASDPVLISYPIGAYVPAIQPRVEATPIAAVSAR